MKILITNDDGYKAKGIHVLAEIMSQFGDVTVVAPKHHQSGMAMSVPLGNKRIAIKELKDEGPGRWIYVDATPVSCVKFALNFPMADDYPDVIVSGINHGSNAATGACYSGTLGAAAEGAIVGIPAIGVSLDHMGHDGDFSAVEKYFPEIFSKLMAQYPHEYGLYYNVNFPDIPIDEIKGVRVAAQGRGKWVKEFRRFDPSAYMKKNEEGEIVLDLPALEEGEIDYTIVGEFKDDPSNGPLADHHFMANGYIAVEPCTLDATMYSQIERLQKLGFDKDFK